LNIASVRSIAAGISLGVLLIGCSGGGPGQLQEVASPAGQHAGQPNLAAVGDQAYLSWIESPDTGEPSLQFAVLQGETWSPSRQIAQGASLLINWADFPSLMSLDGGVLAAHWLATAPSRGGYDVRVALSRDGGMTWGTPVVPHQDASPVEHGFVSLVPSPDGGVSILWLDGRKVGSTGEGDVALLQTGLNAEGMPGPEREVDPRVCECCAPSSIALSGQILAVYRDRSPEEIRDIAIVRFDGTRWSEPRIVSEDRWEIYACPINGPSIDARNGVVAVAWYTASGNKSAAKVAFSTDDGNTFGSAITFDDGEPVGRVDVALLDSGDALVTWIEHSPAGGQVRVKRVDKNGTLHPSLVAGPTSIGPASGFPRIVAAGGGAVAAWTDTGEHLVRTALWQP
jgi:hypothetical protein